MWSEKYIKRESSRKIKNKENRFMIFLVLGIVVFSFFFFNLTYNSDSADLINPVSSVISSSLNSVKTITGFMISEENKSEIFNDLQEEILNKSEEMNQTTINKTIDQNFTQENITKQILENIAIETNITETISNVSITTIQVQAVIGEPVKWKKHVSLEEPKNLTVKLPVGSKNIIVKKIKGKEDKEIISSKITGSVIREGSSGFLSRFFEKIFRLTGGVVGIQETQEEVEVNIEENETEFEIEYETPAPQAFEEDLERSKKITIIGPENIHYENVLAFTEVPEVSKNSVKLYRTTGGIREQVQIINYTDTNENDLIDYIEWIIPDLSEQTYELIIEITKAEHLDADRNFISDIYDKVKELDGVWSETIYSNEYIRVTFETELDSSRDITIYPRIINGTPKIEVYEIDGTEIITEFTDIISNEYNKIYLTNLIGSQDVFDLRIVEGSLEFDYIVDPTQLFFEDWEAGNFNNWNNSVWGIATDRAYGGSERSAKCPEDNSICEMNSTASADTSSASEVNVSFWYNSDDCDSGDAIWYWNDSDGIWNNIGNIDATSLGKSDDEWHYHSAVSSEVKYKHVGFAIRFWAGVDQNENYWLDNINISVTIADTIFPQFSDYQENPENNTAYSQGATYEFNVTITSTNATAGLEFDGTNYTATNLTATLFNATVSGLSAGTYSYYWWSYGNGTSNNLNTSGTRSYTVAQATPTLSGSVSTPIIYRTASNYEGTESNTEDGGCSYSLKRNGVEIGTGSSVSDTEVLGVTTWNYNYSTSGCVNYSAGSDYDSLVVNQNTSLVLGLTATTPIEYPATTDFTGSGCPTELSCSLNISDQIYGAGTISANYSTSGNTNYSASSTTFTVTIDQNTSLQLGLDITPSQSETYGTETTATGSGCPAELPCKLYRNDTGEVTNGEAVTLGVGIYNYTYNTTGNANYSATSISKLLTITQATPTLTKYLNGEADNLTIPYPQQLNASAYTTGGTVKIYRGGNDVTDENGQNVTLGVDYYTYEFNVTGNQNYTDVSSVYLYANITQATGQTSLVFDKTSPQDYGTSINASCSVITGEGNAILYRDGEDVTATENNRDVTLGADTYNYECNMSATQNYTSATNQSSFTIDQETGEVFMYVNNSRANFTAQNGTANQNIWLNATLNSGTGNIELWLNGTLYNTEISPLSNSTNLSIGFYNATAVYSGNTNYTSDTETWWINITEAAEDSFPSVSIVYPENTTYNINVGELNYTASDDINLSACWWSNSSGVWNSSTRTCGTNWTGLISTEDSNTWTVYANDSAGQESSDSVTFFKDTIYPTVSIIYPENITYTTNVSELNYTFTETNCDSVWWNNGTDNSTRQNCGTNWTGLISNEGSNTWTVYVNDTSGNENSSSVTFSKDTASPVVTINSPLNQTYNTNSILFNITATDGGGISACWYSLTSGSYNYSMTQSGNYWTNTNSSMIQGSHTVNFYCNDSSNNMNDSEQETFFIDSIYPSITSLTETPTDSPTYSSGQKYEFNATITDTNLQTVLIEFDGTNYTPSNSGDVYNFSISDLAAGIYNYKWYANDSANNINLTETQIYTINNATGDITLLINSSASNQIGIYGTQTNVSASTQFGSVILYREGAIVTGENNNFVTLGVGYYNYTAVSSGDQNHSSASITRFVNITRADSEVNLTLNETDGNVTISQYSSIWLNGTLITGDSGATLRLYNNEILINEDVTEVSNLTSFSSVEVFNITVFYIKSQNYTTSFKIWWVNITEAPDEQNPSVTSLTESPSDPANYSEEAVYEFNATITDNEQIDIVLLDFNGINYTASNLTADVYNVSIARLGVGTYNYSWYANDTSGNANNTENGNYTINQNTTLQLGLTITPSQSETYGTETTATGSSCPNQLTCKLYRNDTGEVTNGEAATLGVGIYNYTYNTTGNANYSATSISKLLTINQETGVVYTYLNHSGSNMTINQNDSIYLNGTLITGQTGENIKLYNNGTLINEGQSPLSNLTQFINVGLYNITTIYSGNTNYTSAYETWWVNVLEVDLTLPDVSIVYPQNTSYNSVQTKLNYTASDNQDLDKCWYSTNNGETNLSAQTCGTNFTGLNSGQGSSTWTVYANDTSGNENLSSVTFFVDSIVPTIDFVAPTKTNGSSVNENLIEINVTTNDTNLDTIVIRLYNSTNDLIKTNSSANSPFFINHTGLSAGIYYYNATANDSLNNENSTETRTINLILPSLTIIKPKNKTYMANTSLLLDYSASNADTVWYKIDSGQNTTIISQTYFNTSAGSHTLYLYANNSNGVTAKNVTFFINLTQLEIKYDEWKGSYKGNSTNFNEYSFDEIQNLSNIILENTLYGKIIFNDIINITNDKNPADNEIDMDSHINTSENRIEINSTGLPNFNKSATLDLYNLTFSNPRILRDGDVCPSTICTQNSYSGEALKTLSFNVTGFTVYSAEETPVEEEPSVSVTSGGGRRMTIPYECIKDEECKGKDEVCLNHKCVKLFDIKIIDFESPVKIGGFFEFTYFVKGMADISGDVKISFWIEKGKKILTSGSDVIYLGSFEEKTETTKIFLPSNVESGIYQFFVQVSYMNYTIQSHRTIESYRIIEIEVEDEIAKITPREPRNYIIYILSILVLAILILLIRIVKKNNYIEFLNDWKRRRDIPESMEKEDIPESMEKEDIPGLMEKEDIPESMEKEDIPGLMEKEEKIKRINEPPKNIERLKNIIKNFFNNLFIYMREFESKITEIRQMKKKSVYGPKDVEGLEPPKQKYKPEEKENLPISEKKFAEQMVEEVKEKMPKQPIQIPEIKEKKQEEIKPEIKKETLKKKSQDIIEDIATKEQEKE